LNERNTDLADNTEQEYPDPGHSIRKTETENYFDTDSLTELTADSIGAAEVSPGKSGLDSVDEKIGGGSEAEVDPDSVDILLRVAEIYESGRGSPASDFHSLPPEDNASTNPYLAALTVYAGPGERIAAPEPERSDHSEKSSAVIGNDEKLFLVWYRQGKAMRPELAQTSWPRLSTGLKK